MIDPQSQQKMREEINARIETDYELLRQLREEIRPLRSGVRRIQSRATTSISLVGTDGGNNRIQFVRLTEFAFILVDRCSSMVWKSERPTS